MIEKQDNIVHVLCSFNNIPTLAMFIEAAAQASSAFDPIDDIKPKIGFMATVKDVKLFNDIKTNSYLVKVELKVEIGHIKQFYFEAFEKFSDVKYVSGYFTLVIPE